MDLIETCTDNLSETAKTNCKILVTLTLSTRSPMTYKKGLSVLYLPHQWRDFDQADTDTSLGRP